MGVAGSVGGNGVSAGGAGTGVGGIGVAVGNSSVGVGTTPSPDASPTATMPTSSIQKNSVSLKNCSGT